MTCAPTLVLFLTLASAVHAQDSAGAIAPAPSSTLAPKPPPETDWNSILWQSSAFLALEHGFRFATEPGTREHLRGPFFRDYGNALKGLKGWGDTDPFLVNYIGHPMQGAVTSYIYTNNNKTGKMAEFGANRAYWNSRLKAMAYSAAYSAQFELGPIGEASLGNVGSSSVPGTMGWVDLVVTPAGGLGWQVTEDALDRYVIRTLENKLRWGPAIVALRGVLNPSRSFTNVLRLRVPWHRDTRPGWREITRQP
ncbi:MAG TPA: hypothetical protein PLF84_23545 [Bryobacteraceae bacterium]|nr:hypothetical protein [Bryobacteraceae bacterium]